MNFFDFLVGGYSGRGAMGAALRYTTLKQATDAEVKEDNLTVLYTCVKILADNFSRVPVVVKDKDGTIIPHKITDLWNLQPSAWMNPQTARSVSEWDRNTHGNTFYFIKNNSLEYIPAAEISDWRMTTAGGIEYKTSRILSPQFQNRPLLPEWIPGNKILHFRGITSDGVFALSPISAAFATHQMMQNATRTVSAFYKNNAMSPHAIETTIPTGATYQNVLADRLQFKKTTAGIEKAGNAIRLPLGEKITPLAVKFVDQELIKTLQFTRDTISSLYQIPNWMLSENDTTQDIEQQSAAFVSSTLAAIGNVYKHEIEFKLLTLEERKKGIHVEFDFDTLKEVTFGDKVVALGTAIDKGLISPNQAAQKLGFPKIPGKFGDMRFVQMQMIPLELYDVYQKNLVQKDDPAGKSLNDNNNI